MEYRKIKTFEDLLTWQRAIDLTKEVFALTDNGSFAKNFSLRDQIRRATVSISSNISEGFERRTQKEYLHFLSIAKGSAGEVRSQLRVAFEVGYLKEDDYEALRSKLIRLSQMIANQMKGIRRKTYTVQKLNKTVIKINRS